METSQTVAAPDPLTRVVIGAEHDEDLGKLLLAALGALGAKGTEEPEEVIAGSQQIKTMPVLIDGQRLVVESETYVGMSLSGPAALVEQVRLQLNQLQSQVRTITIAERDIELPYPIVQRVDLEEPLGLVLLRVMPPPGELFNRNVYAFDAQGELLWQIPECPHGSSPDKPYMSIRVDVQQRLVAGNWNGFDFLVDPLTGGLTLLQFTK